MTADNDVSPDPDPEPPVKVLTCEMSKQTQNTESGELGSLNIFISMISINSASTQVTYHGDVCEPPKQVETK